MSKMESHLKKKRGGIGGLKKEGDGDFLFFI